MIRNILILFILLFAAEFGRGQSKPIEIEANNLPLNVVLVLLRDQYGFQFSYSDNELSKHKITVSKSFSDKDSTLNYLFKDLPFQIKKSGNVYIIIPDKKKIKEEKKKERLTFQGMW